jgi:hypothetical protein
MACPNIGTRQITEKYPGALRGGRLIGPILVHSVHSRFEGFEQWVSECGCRRSLQNSFCKEEKQNLRNLSRKVSLTWFADPPGEGEKITRRVTGRSPSAKF